VGGGGEGVRGGVRGRRQVDELYSLHKYFYHTSSELLAMVLVTGRLAEGGYTVKKVSHFPVPSRDVTNQALPEGE
jgi:hypothetical protein